MVLRHKALELGLDMSEDGYVLVSAIRAIAPQHVLPFLETDALNTLVNSNAKQRFHLDQPPNQPLNIRIRANQGHSIPIVDPTKLCERIHEEHKMATCKTIVHGTTLKNWNSIRKSGLSRRGRNQIHFAASDDLGKIKSGFRASSECLIYVDIARAIKDGILFWLSANGVVLCDGIGDEGVLAPQYFIKALDVTKSPPTELSLTEDIMTTASSKKNGKKNRDKGKERPKPVIENEHLGGISKEGKEDEH
jgi:2'-phosphotransferase